VSAGVGRGGQVKGVTNVSQLRVVSMVSAHYQGSVIVTKGGEVSYVINQIVEMDVIPNMVTAVYQASAFATWVGRETSVTHVFPTPVVSMVTARSHGTVTVMRVGQDPSATS